MNTGLQDAERPATTRRAAPSQSSRPVSSERPRCRTGALRRRTPSSARATAGRPLLAAPARAVREVGLLALLLVVYQASRLLGGRDVAGAFENARHLLAVQAWLGLPDEQGFQNVLLAAVPLVRAANAYYAAVHLPVTAGVLLWLVISRPTVYRRARTALVGSTAAALAVYLLVPVAPPRLLPGFVDTAALHGPSVYGGPGGSVLTNQYAALPSLHVGWAVLVALACVAAGRTRWRWAWLAHPALTVAVVVSTANHFWLDAAAGALLVVTAWCLAPFLSHSGRGARRRQGARGTDGAAPGAGRRRRYSSSSPGW